MQHSTQSPIVLAAGGTGGHIFPAEALAEVLITRGHRVVLMTDKRFANFQTGVFATIEKRTVRSGSLGGGTAKKVRGLINMGLGVVQARFTLMRLKPRAVVGFGGYPSFPTMLAATQMGLPTVIHEQNAVLGRANRMLASRVRKIATSFAKTLMIAEENELKIALTGNPVRAAVRSLSAIPYPTLNHDGIMQVLVTGGSQGASVFSQIVPAAVAALPAQLRARLRIDQQCREADMAATRAAYEQLGVSVNLAPFFTDIPARLASAHLVIARSGASTVAELSAAGRPGILVPLPTAMDNHQYFNANAFADSGGGWVMAQDGFTAAALSTRLEVFLGHPAALAKAADAAKNAGIIDAADRLADIVLQENMI